MATAMMLIFVLFNVANTFITGAISVKSFTNHYSISDNKLIQCSLSQLLAVIKILIQKICISYTTALRCIGVLYVRVTRAHSALGQVRI